MPFLGAILNRRSIFSRFPWFLALASLLIPLFGTPLRSAPNRADDDAAASPAPTSRPTIAGLAASDVIARMIERNRARNAHLQEYSAVRNYEILDSNGKVSAQALVRIDYRAPGQKTFHRLSEHGSWIVRRLVFDRLLQAEEETSSGQERRESAISEENYSFTISGEDDLGAHHCYVVAVQPRRADKYLFGGKLWIDTEDFGIVKIAGQPAAKLSFWITNANFERQFQSIDGFWLPARDETIVNLRAYGTKVFRIEHGQYMIKKLHAPAETTAASN